MLLIAGEDQELLIVRHRSSGVLIRRVRGISLAVSLMVLSVLLVLGMATTTVGVQGLNLSVSGRNSANAFYTAEAGIAQTVQRLEDDSSLNGTLYQNQALSSSGGSYTVTVYNNLGARTQLLVPGGQVVPPAYALLQAVGLPDAGSVPRNVFLLVKGTRDYFDYAVMTGGSINLQGQTQVAGNVRANGSISFSGAGKEEVSANVVNGGRLLTSSQLSIQSTLQVQSATEEVRAGGVIQGGNKISGTSLVYALDRSPLTALMSNSGSLTPLPSGETIPNPNLATLLAPGTFVQHNETTINGNFDLGGQLHYFPNGVTFSQGSHISGSGTIVVGNGHDAVFYAPFGTNTSPARVNVIALDAAQGTSGPNTPGGSIYFQNGTFINGLIYAHHDVTFNANWRVWGSVVSYYGNVTADANVDFTLDHIPVHVPGFESWLLGASEFGGPITLSAVSWQDGR